VQGGDDTGEKAGPQHVAPAERAGTVCDDLR
jgi:hypothetical protein